MVFSPTKRILPTPSAFPNYLPLLVRRLQGSHDLRSVTSTHSLLLKSGSSAATLTANHLINAYLRCRDITDARKVFDEIPHPNIVSWTSLMAGYVDAGRPGQALSLFPQMPRPETQPNSFTFATSVTACSHLADVSLGREIHTQVEVLGLRSDLVVSTALIDMYGKANWIDDARKVFDGMSDRNVVSWGSMISAYAQNAFGHEALILFGEFLRENYAMELTPNHFLFSSIINACAGVGRLGLGRSAHGAAIRRCHDGNHVVAGALIDMYSKCGCIEYSRMVFDRIEDRSLVPYTSMIVAAAKYGLAKDSLDLFDEMVSRGVRPNSVTLLGVLHACSHSGLVDIGLRYLNSMRTDYGITPSAKHYTCAVDMLGRACRLDEAFELAKEVRAEGDDALMMWSALLSASRIYRRPDLVAEVGKRLTEFDRDVAGAYVMMSNAYTSAGQWENAQRTWAEMRQRGIWKEPGCSWVEVKDVAYVFYAGVAPSAGARGGEVIELLRELEGRMRERGFVGSARNGRMLDREEEEGLEEKDLMVGVHSERLALGFGLISIPNGMTVRVMKNLRMCGDCHEAFKLISDIVGREFVVRDLNRFHHFREGSCTCGDYW